MLKSIKQKILKDKKVDYGYYGSKTIFIKRWLWWKRLELAKSLFLKHSSKINTNTILDFGAEFGFLSADLSKKFKKVFLVEINEKTLAKGIYIHSKYGNKNYFPVINKKLIPLDFVNKIHEKIDLFIFLDVLEHIRKLDTFVKGLRKISSNNAYFIVSLPTENIIYLTLTKFKKEKDHCNRYFEVEKALHDNNIIIVSKTNLLFLFNIYLLKIQR